MNKLWLLAPAFLALAACGGGPDDLGGDGDTRPAAISADAAMLTDDLMARFVRSMMEDSAIARVVCGVGGYTTLSSVKNPTDEVASLARRHGFKGGDEYMAVWGRVNAARTILTQESRPAPFPMNGADLELVRKYRPQIDEAVRKHKK